MVQSVREDDDKGRHTTTHREMFLLPEGGLLIDTPGMRALELWESEEGFRQSFSDIDQLAKNCRFSDCMHQTEPGCSVQEALADGRLDAGRFQSYLKLKKSSNTSKEKRINGRRSRKKKSGGNR